MGIEQELYVRSDLAGRRLILIFCLAPLIMPFLAVGVKIALEDDVFGSVQWPQALSSSAFAAMTLPSSKAEVHKTAAPFGALQELDGFQSVQRSGRDEGIARKGATFFGAQALRPEEVRLWADVHVSQDNMPDRSAQLRGSFSFESELGVPMPVGPFGVSVLRQN